MTYLISLVEFLTWILQIQDKKFPNLCLYRFSQFPLLKFDITFRDHNHSNIDRFLDSLCNFDWKNVPNDVNISMKPLHEKLCQLYHNFCTTMKKYISAKHSRRPWWLLSALLKPIKTKSYNFKVQRSGRINISSYKQFNNILRRYDWQRQLTIRLFL